MNYSGIVVALKPGRLEEGIEALNALPGTEVYHVDETHSRVVVVQEAPSVHDEVEGMKAIKDLPQVAYAAMVYHYFAEDEQIYTAFPKELEEGDACSADVCVPEVLRH
jgi:nitrate reductase NapAB chaperone NapD